MAYCVKLSGENLLHYLNKIELNRFKKMSIISLCYKETVMSRWQTSCRVCSISWYESNSARCLWCEEIVIVSLHIKWKVTVLFFIDCTLYQWLQKSCCFYYKIWMISL